jgi:hypothetical protein
MGFSQSAPGAGSVLDEDHIWTGIRLSLNAPDLKDPLLTRPSGSNEEQNIVVGVWSLENVLIQGVRNNACIPRQFGISALVLVAPWQEAF